MDLVTHMLNVGLLLLVISSGSGALNTTLYNEDTNTTQEVTEEYSQTVSGDFTTTTALTSTFDTNQGVNDSYRECFANDSSSVYIPNDKEHRKDEMGCKYTRRCYQYITSCVL